MSRHLLANVMLVAAQGGRPARMLTGLGYEYTYSYGGTGGTSVIKPTARIIYVGGGGGYGKGPQPFFIPVRQPSPCADIVRPEAPLSPGNTCCPSGMVYDKVKGNEPPVLSWPTEGSTRGKSGKELNDLRQASVNNFRNKCATWVAAKCYDPSMKNIRERLQRQQKQEGVASGPQASTNWRAPEAVRITSYLDKAELASFMRWWGTPEAQALIRSMRA
jgi:hypothetical protein